jgi:hypothetical protein
MATPGGKISVVFEAAMHLLLDNSNSVFDFTIKYPHTDNGSGKL